MQRPFPAEPRQQSNRGLRPWALALLRWLNRRLPWFTPQSPLALVRACRRLLDTALSYGASGSYRMPPVQRQRYSARYGSAYQQLLQREGLR